MIFLDFETRSECDLKKAGSWAYSQHPSTEVLCMAWAVEDGPVKLWTPYQVVPFYFHEKITPDTMAFDAAFPVMTEFEAHNSFFEKAIWKNIMVPKAAWPEIPDKNWSCSAAKASAHSLPRALDKAGSALGLSIQKDQEGKRIMMKLCKPRKPTKNNPAVWHEDPADYQKLYEYCMDDVRAERALSKALRDLNPMEQKIWHLDQKINERGLRVDMEAVEAAMDITAKYIEKGNAVLPDWTDGAVSKATENAKLLKWVQSKGVQTDNITKDTVTALRQDINVPLLVQDVLEIRQKLGKTSVAKYKAIAAAVCQDGRLRGLLVYYGGHTGRWAGMIFQPHNLPVNKFKGNVDDYFNILKMGSLDTFELCYPDVMETISYLIRPLIIPSEGKLLFGGDYKAIEAMALLWLCGDEIGLNIFREGKDIYKDLASTIFRKPVNEITKEERQLGKQGILGLGYQMGAQRFQDTCASYGIKIDIDMAERVKTTYREKYSRVVRLWHNQEGAAMKAIQTKKFVRCGKIGWGIEGDFLYCKLPSKRLMAYYDPKIETVEVPWGTKEAITYWAVNSVTKKWEKHKTYGGKIVENITQAVARDLLAHSMLECEDAGYEIVLHVHDEIMAEKEDGSAEEFGELMMGKPDWAEEIPIDVDPWEGKRYLK